MRSLSLLLLLGLVFTSSAGPTSEAAEEASSEEANKGTVGIMTGELGDSDIRIAADLKAVLNEGDRLRVLPTLGQGSLKNVNDLLYLRGIDMAIVQADALSLVKQQQRFPGLEKQLNYVTKLYGEELHVLARRSIASVIGLQGKKVNFVSMDSGNYVTGQLMLEAFGVNVEPVFIDTAMAIEMVGKGEIDATVLVTAKPAAPIAALPPGSNVHLLPIETAELRAPYRQANLAATDYPNLVQPGRSIDTIAVDSVLMVYNWRSDHWRYAKVARFVDAFLGRFDEFLQRPRDDKWQEVDVAATVDGWDRFPPVQNWLKDNAVAPSTSVANAPASNSSARQQEALAQNPSLRRNFREFLDQHAAEIEAGSLGQFNSEALFERFIVWQRQRTLESRGRIKTPTF